MKLTNKDYSNQDICKNHSEHLAASLSYHNVRSSLSRQSKSDWVTEITTGVLVGESTIVTQKPLKKICRF